MNLNQIKEVTEAANLLADNHHEMTAKAVSAEYSILWYEYGLLQVNGDMDIGQVQGDRTEALRAIGECIDSMRRAEDSLQYHCAGTPTDL